MIKIILPYSAIFAILLSLLSLLSCSNDYSSITKNDFIRLCQIYEEVARKPIAIELKERRIFEQVQVKLPSLFKGHFKYLSDFDRAKRYETIQRAADHELGTNHNWECDVMRHYFEGRFDAEKDTD